MLFIWICTAFLIGSIPFGFLISRSRGVDIRAHGSGNVGATNVGRVLGKKAGAATFALDFFKGILASSLAYILSPVGPWALAHGLLTGDLAAILGLSAIFGHCFSPFLRFRGGKGVACGGGAFLTVAPAQTVIGLVLFVVVLLTTGYVSAGSIAATLFIPFAMLATFFYFGIEAGWTIPGILAATAGALLIVWRHRENLKRLMTGTENSVRKQRSADKPSMRTASL